MDLLMYSSGLDSELYRLLLNPQKLLFFKSGAKYQQREEEQLQRFISEGILKKEDLIVDDTLNFSSLEDANAIVPMRNIFYFLRAFEYANNIEIGITYYDLHYDKQPDVLGGLLSFVQTYYYGREIPDTWNGERPHILYPFATYTKAELIRKAIREGIDVSHIPTLRTCYDKDSKKGCGKCKSCVSKAIALANNGMFKADLFDADPRIHGLGWLKTYRELAKDNIEISVFDNEVNVLMQ